MLLGLALSMVGGSRGDPSLRLDYDFLLKGGSNIGLAVRRGPVPNFSRASSGTHFDENGTLVTATTNNPRFDHDPVTGAPLGLLIEQARTNEALHSADLTNAVWTKTNTTAAKDAAGLDGGAGSASTLTASANNGTCFQTVTKASATNTYSLYVRRKTGTGTVEITDNGGTNFTDITASINASTYSRFDLTRTQANPQVGFRLGTSGDEIEVDGNQLEAGAFPTSTIATTTASVTRAADVCDTTDMSWFNNQAGAWFIDAQIASFVSTEDYSYFGVNKFVSPADDEWKLLNFNASNNTILQLKNGGVQQAFFGTVDTGDENAHKIAYAYAPDDLQLYVDGSDAGSDSSATLPTGHERLQIGETSSPPQRAMYIRRLRYYNVRKSNAFLQADTS